MFTLALIVWAFRVEAKPHRTVLAFCWLSDAAVGGAALFFFAKYALIALAYWTYHIVPAINQAWYGG